MSISEHMKFQNVDTHMDFGIASRAAPVVLYSSVPQRILGVIPARYSSSRFPGKALVSIAGKTMLQHVWERTSQARYLTDVVIATDDERIRAAAQEFRARVVMTRADHASGTDRVAEAASASQAPRSSSTCKATSP